MDGSVYYGGMPSKKIKAPIIKEKFKTQQKPKVKKFSINQFLDKYLNELKPKPKPYDSFIQRKALE
jgi:hypothetical protein